MSNATTQQVDLSTLPKVNKAVNLFPDHTPHVFRYRFNFRHEGGFYVGMYALPFEQPLTFKSAEREKLFYNHCLPCQLYHDGSCPGGSRLMGDSLLFVGNPNSASQRISCFKKVRIQRIDKSVVVKHPALFISGRVTRHGDFCEKYIYHFRPKPDLDLNRPNLSFESGIQLLPYALANVYSGDGRLCLGGRDSEEVLFDDFPRTFTQHYDWGFVNQDLQPTVPGTNRVVAIEDWITNYNSLYEAAMVEDSEEYSSFCWEEFSNFFNNNRDFDDFFVSVDKSNYTHYVQYRANRSDNGYRIWVMFFYNPNDTSRPVLRIQYSEDLSLFDRCLKPYDQVVQELSD